MGTDLYFNNAFQKQVQQSDCQIKVSKKYT